MSKKEGEHYEKSYTKLEDSISQLKELDNQLSNIDKKHHLKIIEVLEKQLPKLNEINNYAAKRMEDIIDNYKDILQGLEFRRKEADKKLKKFKKETKDKIASLKKNSVHQKEIDMIERERSQAQKSHDDYIQKIDAVEKKIKRLQQEVEKSCRNSAYNSKRLSRKK